MIMADGVQIAGGPWCLSILFTQGRIDFATNAVAQEDKVQLNLPWGVAKAMLMVITEAMDAYEKIEGPIALPKSFQEKFKTHAEMFKALKGE